MSDADIEQVIDAQAALIAALDAGDVAAIEQATASLSQLLSGASRGGAVVAVRAGRIDHALKQTEAARTRVNFLADRTRQRLDRLAQRRGGQRPPTYNAAGRIALFRA